MIGMGLFMIEKTFSTAPVVPDSRDSGSPPHKRIMMARSESPTDGLTGGRNGTGYAGSGTEDVKR